MDFHVAGKDASFHILSTHHTGPDDSSPLNYISKDRLAELEKIEAASKVRPEPVAPVPADEV